MDIVKKNIVSIICGVVALVAVVAAFFPMGGKFDELNKLLDDREKKYRQAEALLKKPRNLPTTDLISTAEPLPLKVFPSPAITRAAKEFLDKLIAQSKGVLEEAVKINKRESVVGPKGVLLLTPDSLPEPKPNADNTFKKELQPEYDLLRGTVLAGGYPPTAEEIKKEDDKLLAEHQKKRISAGEGQPAINEDAIQKAYQADSLLLPDRMRLETATKHRIYVDPETLMAPKEITTVSQSPSPPSIWYAQAALWVQEDVCRALNEANHGSANVLDAPIKRLVSLNIPFGPGMYVRPAGTGDPSAGAGAPVSRFGNAGGGGMSDGGAPNNTEPKHNYSISPTGRTCNSMYDVVAFTMVLHVEQTKVPAILTALSRNRFMSVNEVSLTSLDSKALMNLGFVYGPAAVAEMTVKCEAIQLREWTVPLMPREIRDQLIGPGVDYQFQLLSLDKKPG